MINSSNKISVSFWQASIILGCVMLCSCSMQRQVGKQAKSSILNNPAFGAAHVGIAIFNVENNKLIYGHDAEKLFIPASNTKLFACYAGIKHLGDSVLAAYYSIEGDRLKIQATGDPTFLHPDFPNQRLFNLMKQPRFSTIELHTPFEARPFGRGWAWDDFPYDYAAERDPFPLYGNVATFTFYGDTLTTVPPKLPVIGKPVKGEEWDVFRSLGGHFFSIKNNTGSIDSVKTITLASEQGAFADSWLQDTLHKPVERGTIAINKSEALPFYSQPTDSLLSLMMHRSDNFFAEQTLLMVSNKMLGVMNDTKVIDSLLNNDYKDLPQKPKWVDGSGLSRYNLFSPNDFVWLLGKMKDDVGLDRIKTILPTGDEGTLKGLYVNNLGRIYAKTGTLSNVVALSGYLLTRKNKTLIFSVLVNNHVSTAANVRRAIESFLTSLAEKY